MSAIENWIRLAKLESPKKAVALVEYFGSADEIFVAKPSQMMEVSGMTAKASEKLGALAMQPVDEEIAALDKADAHIVNWLDPGYPVNLRQIYDPPPVLFIKGDLRESDRQAVAVVGTRKPSEYGKSMAFKISRDLARMGCTVVSGGARGVDTAAHTGALQGGRTLVVLGCGIDIAYPYENRGLFMKAAESGAVISEFVPGIKPDAWRFPARNRLVSGLSLGVFVVESGASGGAMITAMVAGEQNREIWALPGTTDNPFSDGPHRLIKDGARLVDSAEDILTDIGVAGGPCEVGVAALPDNISPEQRIILELLTLHPKHMEEIIVECKLSSAAASSALTMLEMVGLVRRVPGNSYVRAV